MKDKNSKQLWNILQKRRKKKIKKIREFCLKQPSNAKFHSLTGDIMRDLEEE